MSLGTLAFTIAKRVLGLELLKQEIQGRLPKGPFEDFEDLSFSELEINEDDPKPMVRYKITTKRDGRYATASPVYIRRFGMSQNMHHLYTGSKQLIDGGME
jgi:hypothetical protein